MGGTWTGVIAWYRMREGALVVFIPLRDLQLRPNNQIPPYFLSKRVLMGSFVQHSAPGRSAGKHEAEGRSTW